MFDEFLKSAAGHAVFGAVIAVLALVIVELNYKLFFKYVLDFIFALVFIVALSPVLAVLSIVSKSRAGTVLESKPCLGAKGKIIFVHSFAGIKKLGKNLPRLFDILCAKLSFVGIGLLDIGAGALLSDEAMARFYTRPGLVNCLVLYGGESLTYEEAFVLDAKYCRRRELFTDIFAVLKSVVYFIRGEKDVYLGECRFRSYTEDLLVREEITLKDAENAELAGQRALEERRKTREVKNSKYN